MGDTSTSQHTYDLLDIWKVFTLQNLPMQLQKALISFHAGMLQALPTQLK